MTKHHIVAITSIAASAIFLTACGKKEEPKPVAEAPAPVQEAPKTIDPNKFLTQPLVSEIFSADPSAHVFGARSGSTARMTSTPAFPRTTSAATSR